MARKSHNKTRKRSSNKVLNALQIAERQENLSGSDEGNESDEMNYHDGIMDARKLLNEDKDSDEELEDEELDSDGALGSDDDYDILNSKFSQTIRDKKKRQILKSKKGYSGDLESSDDEAGYSSIDENQLVTLSEVWDLDDKDLEDSSEDNGKDIKLTDNLGIVSLDDEEGSTTESLEASDKEEDIFGSSEDNENDVDLSNTLSYVQSSLKKPSKEMKRLVNETTAENEYSLPTRGEKLSVNDMLSAADDAVSKDSILLTSHPENGKSKALATPLPKRIQERHDRKEAYELAKSEISKWDETVQANRRAEVLKFPMNPTPQHGDAALTFRSNNDATTQLEKKIHEVLKDSALVDDSKEATFEEIAIAKMTPDEIKKRTHELRLMRELMFRDEKRAKRIKKIKSKQYHKIKKKERLRNQELVEGDESDPEDHDMKRAQERMALRHKTQSQWAKSMIKSGLSKDVANRSDLEEMLRNGERLRAKQLGYTEGEQSDEDISDVENEIFKDDSKTDEIESKKLGRGVLAMDFMKNAAENNRRDNLNEIEKFKRSNDENGLKEVPNSVNVIRNQGRRVYEPIASSMKDDMINVNNEISEEIKIDESKNLDHKLALKFKSSEVTKEQDVRFQQKPHVQVEEKVDEVEHTEQHNPWLTESDLNTQKSSKVSIVDKSSSKLSKSAAKIAKALKKSAPKQKEISIDMNETLKVIDQYGSESENEDSSNVVQFKQKDLIKEAFAGDDVIQEFEREKKRTIREEDNREEDLTLPGWGDWHGSGKQKKRKVVRKINGVVEKDKRRDKNLKGVIINEKVNKKNLKYQSSAVPFPFEHKEQFERSLRMPIGQEWTSRESHQKLTMPRVITKQGTVINPLKAPFK
ncbi:uncharacterized protein PRCAT00004459001 [Priceomyces carsonii]|uniref:uncharacterized protein n=1 Tax=Priceomyces carsonii TaxID=28549 RepID=UPI002EDA8D3D|nr:unnamed protein product [Priceomyces carsonii]